MLVGGYNPYKWLMKKNEASGSSEKLIEGVKSRKSAKAKKRQSVKAKKIQSAKYTNYELNKSIGELGFNQQKRTKRKVSMRSIQPARRSMRSMRRTPK